MHKTGSQAVEAADRLKSLVAGAKDVDIMIAPTYTALYQVAQTLKGSAIALGAQDLYWEEQGAFTGKISSEMLVDAGCSHVIIGHSERRQFFGETDETVNRKNPGSSFVKTDPCFLYWRIRDGRAMPGIHFSVLDKQVRVGLKNFVSDDLAGFVIAYEPVWAIGTGKTATREQAQDAHQFIRSLLETLFGNPFASTVRILYGGSVKPDNVRALMEMADVDGGPGRRCQPGPRNVQQAGFF
jgi:triosephosphate isomerase